MRNRAVVTEVALSAAGGRPPALVAFKERASRGGLPPVTEFGCGKEGLKVAWSSQ